MSNPDTDQRASVGLVSLGCPKALVDSEEIVSRLKSEGYDIVPDYQQANLVVVNTCGFIDSAKAESLESIGEALEANSKVLVTGCMGAKPEDITRIHPKVLGVTGPHQAEAVVRSVNQYLPRPHDPRFDLVPPGGLKLTPQHYAYLKISEGCNHKCSFCIIPSMRGRLVSRPLGMIMREAEQLAERGVQELLVISQDTSAYGVDLKYQTDYWRGREYESRIYDLCDALGELGIWVRLHYVYPYPHVDQLIGLMNAGRILPYLDIPFQHASRRILKAMKRPAAAENTLERVRRWRRECPELVIRSTFIVGFPGEIEDDFQQLLDWLDEAELDRVGCFTYSPVAGARANKLPDAVPSEVAEERWQRFMEHQSAISARRLKRRIDSVEPVLIDTVEGSTAIGRSYGDAPEIDGQVIVADAGAVRPGDAIMVRITRTDQHDLFGQMVDELELSRLEAI